eukprot:7659736-Pyramimonas_sp.AAC.3
MCGEGDGGRTLSCGGVCTGESTCDCAKLHVQCLPAPSFTIVPPSVAAPRVQAHKAGAPQS